MLKTEKPEYTNKVFGIDHIKIVLMAKVLGKTPLKQLSRPNKRNSHVRICNIFGLVCLKTKTVRYPALRLWQNEGLCNFFCCLMQVTKLSVDHFSINMFQWYWFLNLRFCDLDLYNHSYATQFQKFELFTWAGKV